MPSTDILVRYIDVLSGASNRNTPDSNHFSINILVWKKTKQWVMRLCGCLRMEQCHFEFGSILESSTHILISCLIDNIFYTPAYHRIDGAHRRECLPLYGTHGLIIIRSFSYSMSRGKHVEQKTTQRIYIRSMVNIKRIYLLRRHIAVSTDLTSDGLTGTCFHILCNTKIDNANPPIRSQHDIRRFYIAVDLPLTMNISKCVQHFAHNTNRFLLGERLTCLFDFMFNGLTLNILHGKV